jgi:hypothetical protein
MSNHSYSFHNDDFSLDMASNYSLLLQVGSDAFSYAIVHHNKLMAWQQNIEFQELEHSFDLRDLLFADYQETIIGLSSTGFTLVPSSIYNTDRVASIARFLDVQKNERVVAAELDSANMVVYKVEDEVVKFVNQDFVNKKYALYAQGWITAISNSGPSAQNLYVNVGGEKADFLYFTDNKLRYYNSFSFTHEDDLVYYTSLICNELQLDPHNTTLVTSGEIDSGDNTLTRLAEFFENLIFNDLSVVQLPAEVVSHQLLAITALSLCGSSVAL